MSALLKSKADEFGCVDFELAKSQLNIDELLESKDQSNDIEKAFNVLKESKPILLKREKKILLTNLKLLAVLEKAEQIMIKH